MSDAPTAGTTGNPDPKDPGGLLGLFFKLSGINTDATMTQRVERLVFLSAAGLLWYCWEKRDTVVPKLIGDDRAGFAAAAVAALLVVVRVVAWAGKRFDRCEQESMRLRDELSEVTAELASAQARWNMVEGLLFPDREDPTDADWSELLTRHKTRARHPARAVGG